MTSNPPLSLHALDQGIREARRIIRDAEAFDHARERVLFAPEFKKAALAALDELEREARLWRTATELHAANLRHRLDIEAIEREVPLSFDDRVLR